MAGDKEALQTLADSPEHEQLVIHNRLAPALAIRATDLGVDGPQLETWLQHMRHNAVLHMRLETARNELGKGLATAGIPWAPLKGLGLDPPVYLKVGDVVELGIDGLGTSRQNAVAFEPPGA